MLTACLPARRAALPPRPQWDAPDVDPLVFLTEAEDESVPRLEVRAGVAWRGRRHERVCNCLSVRLGKIREGVNTVHWHWARVV